MHRRNRPALNVLIAVIVACCTPQLGGGGEELGTTRAGLTSGVDVLTQRYDASRTGQNTNETILTLSNVNSTSFGKLFTLSVDGYVFAQPLYKGNVTIGGTAHNVVFVATCHDSLYAFDADVGTSLWHKSFINPPSITTQPAADTQSTDITPEVGILSTPVIDPTSGTIYVVTKTKEPGGTFHRLHAVDITTGTEKVANAELAPVVAGIGAGSNGGSVQLNAAWQQQRPGLTLVNGVVYVAWGSSGDNFFTWHGWVAGYNAATLAQVSVWNASPNGNFGGVFMSGNGIPFDSSGNLYFSTGNGDFDGTSSYSNAVVKLSTSGGLAVADYYAPFNQQQLGQINLDFSTGGVVLLPDAVGTASHPHLVAASGKTGTIYLLDRDNLGKYNASYTNPDSQIVQYIFNALGTLPVNNLANPMVYVENNYTTPAYWRDASGKDHTYWGGVDDRIKMFDLVNGLLTTTPVSQSPTTYGYPGANPSISSNGNSNGILWTVENATAAILHAYDATNLAHELYTSTQAPNNRDQMGAPVKFVVPTVTNGKVYVGYQLGVAVYGLMTQTPQAAAPTIAPSAGTYANPVTVSLSSSTPGSTIYYTTNGSTPTAASTTYTAPFTVSQSATVSAIAVAIGFLDSPVATAAYVIGTPPPPPPPGGLAFVQGGYATPQASQASVAVKYSSAQSAGDLSVVVVGWNDSKTSVTSVRDTMGNAYALAVGPTVQSGFATQSIYYAKNIAAAATGANTVTVTFAAAAAFPDVRILEYAGVDTTSPLDTTAAAMGTTGASDSGPATTTNANDLIIGANLTQGYTSGPGTGFTSRFITNPDGDIAEDRIVSATGSYSATTAATGGAWVMQLVAFKAAVATPPSPPTAPTNLTARVVSAGEIDLAWTNTSTTQTAVAVERSTDNATFTALASLPATAKSYADTSVAASTQYFYRIRATNAAGNSPYTASVSATTPAPPPPPTAPTGLTATAVSSIEIDLTWTNTSTTQTGVKVERSTDGGATFTQIALAVATATTFADTNLLSSATYTYRMRATNGTADSPYSNVVSATTPAAPPPTAPTGLTAMAASGTQINLSWTNTATQTGVALERSRDDANFEMIALTASGATGYSDAGLLPQTQYDYRVRAVGGAGVSAYSSTATATTGAPPPPPGAITFVQGNYATPQTAQASVLVKYNSAQKAGDLGVVVVGWNDSKTSVTSVSDTMGNAYALAVGPTVQSGFATQSIYYAKNIKAAAAGANTVTVTFAAAAAFPDVRILEYSGIDTTSPLDATAAAVGTTSASSSGPTTITNANDLIIGANLTQGYTSGPGTGFTSRFITNPDGDIAEDRIVSATGSYSATTAATGGAWVMQLVAFKAAPAAPPPALSFANDVYSILSTSGGCTGCHSATHAPSPSGGLDLSTGGAAGAYTVLINKPSPSGGGAVCDTAPLPSAEKLVVPGSSELSLLYNKLAGGTWAGSATVLCGSRMPPVQDPPLTAQQLATVRTWIDQGANP